jgi:hypothetical protein
MKTVIAGILWVLTLIAFLASARGAPEMLAMAFGWTVIAMFHWGRGKAEKK